MHAEQALGFLKVAPGAADGYSGYLEDYKLWRGMVTDEKGSRPSCWAEGKKY